MSLLRIIRPAISLLLMAASAIAGAENAPAEASLKPFTASYSTEWKLGWFSIDIDATRTLRRLPNGHWQLTFQADTSTAALTETSEFVLKNGRIQPAEYSYKATGLFNEPDRNLLFVPELKVVKDLKNNQTYTNAWDTEVQDNLTYMLQAGLDLASGKKELSYSVFEKNKSKAFRFKVAGEETINTAIGKLKTVKVEQIRSKKNREVFAWYAIDYGYQLVQLRDRENGKTRYQIDIKELSR